MLRIASALTAAAVLLQPGSSRAADPQSHIVLRLEDQRVADVAYRLASRSVVRCAATIPVLGLALHHLGQYALADRAAATVQYGLDRGPGVLAVVIGGPANAAGLQAGDVIAAIDGVPVPSEVSLDQPHDQKRARLRADQVSDLLDTAAADGSVGLTVIRPAGTMALAITPVPACRSRVHLARSNQLNAFADGLHVLLTTRLLTVAPTDDELAFVIAHEMAHNILGHAAQTRAMKQEKRGLSAMLARPALTRQRERAADLLAADMLLDSGYSIDGAAAVLYALDAGLPGPAFLANHDSMASRAAALRAHAAARAVAAR